MSNPVRKAVVGFLVFGFVAMGLVCWLLNSIPLGKFQDDDLRKAQQCLLFNIGEVRVLPGNQWLGELKKADGKWIYENLGNTWEVHPSVYRLEMIPVGGFVVTTVKTNVILKRILFAPSQS